jgi:hypothetical protein
MSSGLPAAQVVLDACAEPVVDADVEVGTEDEVGGITVEGNAPGSDGHVDAETRYGTDGSANSDGTCAVESVDEPGSDGGGASEEALLGEERSAELTAGVLSGSHGQSSSSSGSPSFCSHDQCLESGVSQQIGGADFRAAHDVRGLLDRRTELLNLP